MSAIKQTSFSFSTYRKAWNTSVSEADSELIRELLEHNPLLNETLMLQGSALAVKDVVNMRYPLILGDVERVCGWPKTLFFEEGVEVYIAKIPQPDQMGLAAITACINTYTAGLSPEKLKTFRAVFDYRMLRRDGRVARICQESIVLKADEQGNTLFLLALVSDVTRTKPQEQQHLYLTDGTEQLLFAVNDQHECVPVELLRKREMEILTLLNQKLTSEQIADRLSISVHTVNTHRQNMIRAMGVSDTNQLIHFLTLYRLLY